MKSAEQRDTRTGESVELDTIDEIRLEITSNALRDYIVPVAKVFFPDTSRYDLRPELWTLCRLV